MKTLILSCSTGQGHNSCASAIKEYFELQGQTCCIVDGLSLISGFTSAVISQGHAFIYKYLPGFFRWGYSHAEKHPELFDEKSAVYRFLGSARKKLLQLIEEGGYDCVICTHVFTALMLKNAVKPGKPDIVSAFVATDYTCSPGAANCQADVLFIPSNTLLEEFIDRGAEIKRLEVSGIPVRRKFYVNQPKNEAKLQFGIAQEHRHLLLLGGSMGCGPMEQLLARICRQLPEDWEISVVCAGNHSLEKKLRRIYCETERVHILSYVDDMSALMDSAELCLTKPGGISITEAVVKRLPMLLSDAVSGCESYNCKRLVESGGAATAVGVEGLCDKCRSLMADEEALKSMQQRLDSFVGEAGAKVIYERMMEMKND